MYSFSISSKFFCLTFLIGLCSTLIDCKEDDFRSSLATPIIKIRGQKISCKGCRDFGEIIETNGNQLLIGGYNSISILNYENDHLDNLNLILSLLF